MDYSLLIGLHFHDDYSSPNDKHFGKLLLSCNPDTLKIYNNRPWFCISVSEKKKITTIDLELICFALSQY